MNRRISMLAQRTLPTAGSNEPIGNEAAYEKRFIGFQLEGSLDLRPYGDAPVAMALKIGTGS
jgi:hypothetical protein